MAAIVEHGCVGAVRLPSEIAKGVVHAALVEIVALDYRETDLLQGSGDVSRVVAWIGKRDGILIS